MQAKRKYRFFFFIIRDEDIFQLLTKVVSSALQLVAMNWLSFLKSLYV